MNSAGFSLRVVVEKWFAATPVRVTRFKRTRISQSRFVRVETRSPSSPVSILFFKHEDGAWRVFPPDARRLTMHSREAITDVCN